ncbi:MAG TPA: prolyl oligopeptidase family serine peptidase [Chthonomonadales bacterium]|nr:prolyl oligopeptidase family serine peptidase [Chthonomonadales bacterium]
MLWTVVFVVLVFAAMQGAVGQAPPPTPRHEVRETLHGVEIVDPYRWLEDQWSPETRAWVEAQNAHTEGILEKLPGRAGLKRRVTQLMRVGWMSTPWVRGPWLYYQRMRPGQELPTINRRRGATGREEVLIDSETLSPDRSRTAALMDVTTDGTLIAYGIRQGGEDEVEVRLMEPATRRELPDRLPKARYYGGVSLMPDRSALYYSINTEAGPRVYRHTIGADPATSQLVFGEGYGPEYTIGVSVSENGRYLLLAVYFGSSGDRTEVHVQDLTAGGPIVPIVKGMDARFEPQIAGDTVFMLTDWHAPKGRILAVDIARPARDAWREVVPAGPYAIQGFSLAGGELFVETLRDVVSRVTRYGPDGMLRGEVELPGIGSVGGFSGQWSGRYAFYSFSSFTTPFTVMRYRVRDGRQSMWARMRVPVDPNRFEVRQVWVTSKDGTRLPMFLVHARGLVPDGQRPTLLTGYGGFNLSQTPGFRLGAVLFAERGGVFALPALRGGGEYGEAWHRAGKLENKQNTFDDFIASAEWLIANGYTSPDKLAIAGGSNGGLLVGAALTQRPELFRAVYCGVPLLDMVRYHLFLVARFWVPEYGSSEDPEQFRWLYAYSPYHRVRQGVAYPAVLFDTGDADTRVAPLHAKKMAALMQGATASRDRPVLLRYDTKAGHSGGRPLSQVIEDVTAQMAFLLWQVGALGKVR